MPVLYRRYSVKLFPVYNLYELNDQLPDPTGPAVFFGKVKFFLQICLQNCRIRTQSRKDNSKDGCFLI